MTLRDRVGLGIGVGAPSCPPGDALTSPRRVSLFGTTSRVLAKDPFEAPRRLAPSPRKRPARDDARATTDAEAAAADDDASVAPRKLPRRARVLDPEDARASSLSLLSPGENAAAAAAAAAERKDECLEDDDEEEDADADDAKSPPPLSCVTMPPAPSTAESSTADASGGGGGGGGGGGARLADAFSAIQLLTPVSGAGEGGRSRALSSRLDAAWDL